METKRFIGNDMPRLYARIRRDIGPDAIIVRTRSLLREGAEPLIEILAAPDDGSGLPSELQYAMHNSVLGRVDPSMTVGDLEDVIAREARATAGYRHEEAPFEDDTDRYDPGAEDEPAWSPPAFEDSLEAPVGPDGFNEAQLLDQLAAELEKRAAGNPDLAIPPAFQHSDEGGLPAFHATARPESPAPHPRAPRPGEAAEPVAPRLESVDRESPLLQGLQEAGFSRYAAECAVELASPGASPEYAVAQSLTAGRTDYPAEDETAVISVQGPPGGGRTTALLRMALDCHAAGRDTVIALAGDPPDEVTEYIRRFARWAGIDFHEVPASGDLGKVARKARKGACIFVDVPPGPWRASLPVGVRHFRYLSAPAVLSVEDLRHATSAFDPRAFSGIIPTAVDVAGHALAPLNLAIETGLGLAFLSAGVDPSTGITVADPFTLASGSFTTPTGGQTDGRVTAIA